MINTPTFSEFSTQSSKLSGKTVTRLILNADGIYLSSYAALHLNLRLSLHGHYKVLRQSISCLLSSLTDFFSHLAATSSLTMSNTLFHKQSPNTATELVSRREFLDSVLGSGLLVYLSPVWLSEVYDLVNELDVFEFGLRCGEGGRVNTLKNLLVDLDGLGKTHRGAQLLCDYREGSGSMRDNPLTAT